jgi:hypothetical protein
MSSLKEVSNYSGVCRTLPKGGEHVFEKLTFSSRCVIRMLLVTLTEVLLLQSF